MDVSGALAMDGVYAAVSGADFPSVGSGEVLGGEGGGDIADTAKNIMARDKALYHGHAVAAVAATSLELAEQALGAIKVDYEVLTPCSTCSRPWKRVPRCSTRTVSPRTCRKSRTSRATSPSVMTLARGNVDEGLEQADVVVEGEYRIPMAHQGYIEPHACTVTVNEEGKATVWCCTQGHFDFRSSTAQILDWPIGDLKFIASEIGGGFGGKTVVYLEPVAIMLSRQAGRPVKMVMTREEVFRATGPTSGTVCRVKVGRSATAASRPPRRGWPTRRAPLPAPRWGPAPCRSSHPTTWRTSW